MAFSTDPQAFDVIHDLAPKELKGTVYILGKKYELPREKEAMMEDVRSRIWCTYRRNFRCINFRRPSAPNVDKYNMILHKFLDIRGSEYSIQMIALQGADFGRPVGQWFGPNNVAQAIRKLVAYDMQSQLAVHVCMDMLVVIDDLKATAREPHGLPDGLVNVTNERGESIKLDTLRCRSMTELIPSSPDISNNSPSCMRSSNLYPDLDDSEEGSPCGGKPLSAPLKSSSPFLLKTTGSVADPKVSGTGVTYPSLSFNNTKRLVMDESLDFMKLSIRDDSCLASPSPSSASTGRGSSSLRKELVDVKNDVSSFRSLLIFIPLRLGQDKFNELYTKPLKDCLTLPQSVGFIGGRPRHALYFIGFNDNDLLYLDPHTTQQTVQPRPDGSVPNSTYHCSSCSRMPITSLDPSLALGFFCKDEEDLDSLVYSLRKVVLRDCKLNLFDLTEHRPCYWGPQENSMLNASVREPFVLVDGEPDLEDYEIIEWPVMSPTYKASIHPQQLGRSSPYRGMSLNCDWRENSN